MSNCHSSKWDWETVPRNGGGILKSLNFFYHPKQWLIWVKNWRVCLFGILFQELELNIGSFWSLERFSSKLCRQLFLHCRLNKSLNKGVPLESGLKFAFWGTCLYQYPYQTFPHSLKPYQAIVCESFPLLAGLESRNAHMWHCCCWLVLQTSLAHLAASPALTLESDFSQCILDKAERSGGMSRDVEASCHLLRCLYAWLIIA